MDLAPTTPPTPGSSSSWPPPGAPTTSRRPGPGTPAPGRPILESGPRVRAVGACVSDVSASSAARRTPSRSAHAPPSTPPPSAPAARSVSRAPLPRAQDLPRFSGRENMVGRRQWFSPPPLALVDTLRARTNCYCPSVRGSSMIRSARTGSSGSSWRLHRNLDVGEDIRGLFRAEAERLGLPDWDPRCPGKQATSGVSFPPRMLRPGGAARSP